MHREPLNERGQRRGAHASIGVEHNLRGARMLRTEVPRRQLLCFRLQPLVGRPLADDPGEFFSLAVDALSFALCAIGTMSEKRQNG